MTVCQLEKDVFILQEVCLKYKRNAYGVYKLERFHHLGSNHCNLLIRF